MTTISKPIKMSVQLTSPTRINVLLVEVTTLVTLEVNRDVTDVLDVEVIEDETVLIKVTLEVILDVVVDVTVMLCVRFRKVNVAVPLSITVVLVTYVTVWFPIVVVNVGRTAVEVGYVYVTVVSPYARPLTLSKESRTTIRTMMDALRFICVFPNTERQTG